MIILDNIFGFTFYALDLKQVQTELIDKFGKAEAILFSNNDLENNNWEKVWRNLSKVAEIIGYENLSFHFPMDNCNYIDDAFIKQRLVDTICRANMLGITKVIIHPNLRYKINEWNCIDRKKMQTKLFDFINQLDTGNVELCLENMPPIGNKFDDADSSVLFVSDINPKIDYTWDICHYFNVVTTMELAIKDNKWKDVLADIEECHYLDFKNKLSNIKHYHFSAFEKIANPFSKQICNEGVLPEQSCVNESYYAEALKIIYNDAVKNNKRIIFEISEDNYYNRINIFKMLEWAKIVIDGEKGNG